MLKTCHLLPICESSQAQLILFVRVQYTAMGNDTRRTINRAKAIFNAASAVSM